MFDDIIGEGNKKVYMNRCCVCRMAIFSTVEYHIAVCDKHSCQEVYKLRQEQSPFIFEDNGGS